MLAVISLSKAASWHKTPKNRRKISWLESIFNKGNNVTALKSEKM